MTTARGRTRSRPDQNGERDDTEREAQPRPQRSTRRLRDVIREARAEFELLTGRPVSGVSAIRSQDRGWSMCFEVVELERVPASTSVLGSYEVELDEEGSIVNFERTARYYRNQASDGDT